MISQSPQALREHYERLAGGGRCATSDLTCRQLFDAFMDWARDYYPARGNLNNERRNIEYACAPMLALYADTPAQDFGALQLKACRAWMIERGLGRTTINARIGKLRRVFRWAVAETLTPPSVLHGLTSVEPLAKGRSAAPDHADVAPVPISTINATMEHLTPVLRDMVLVQLYSGCRPHEVCIMRGCDIETSRKVWRYRPSSHKNTWRGHERVIALGPAAQAIIATRLSIGFIFTHSRGAYTSNSYGKAIRTAAKLAGVERWSPNRLRHTAGTKAREELGLECAGAMLGHRRIETTQIYAAQSAALAEQAAMRIG